ncbi:MAG TPA: hypothetical protein GX714_14140 [Chloroflexi bacterium]|jgi:hypothetical protein|nr:hypothetical protein [Chloroflexota bacterium]
MRVLLARCASRGIAIVVLAALLLSGCQAQPARCARANDDWSRGVRVGTASLNSPVAMAVDAQGRGIHLLWTAEDEAERQILRYAQLDASGTTTTQSDLDLSERPNRPSLTLDTQGGVHATWLAREGDVYRLYHALLDAAGQPVAEPVTISPPGIPVHSHTALPASDGGITLFWGAPEGPAPGLYYARVAADGSGATVSQALGVVGFEPSAVRARDGSVHLAWRGIPDAGRESITYGRFDEAAGTLTGMHEFTAFGVLTGLVSHGPCLGIARGRAYVFWSLERRGGGMSLPSAESQYVSFPLGAPQAAGKPRDVIIPEENHPLYQATSSAYQVHTLASAAGASASRFVYLPSAVAGEQDELATAFSVQITGRTKSIVQVVLALWSDGELVGYQIVGQTESTSLRPTLAADAEGDLHLAWIDTAGFGQYAIYYASTALEAQQNLNRLGPDDVTAALLGVVWGLAQAASFFPIVLVWLFPPLVVLALYAFIRAEDGLDRLGSRIMLGIGALMYIGSKLVFRPDWFTALPLPRGTPTGLADAIVYAAPLLITAVAILVTWLFVRRRAYASLLPTFGVLALSDALLTLLVYVPGILAE